MLGVCLSHPQVPETHLDVLWGQSCVSLGMKKGERSQEVSPESAGHQGSDWEELGDTLSGYPIPALCPWSFKGAYITSFPCSPTSQLKTS